MTRPAVLPFTFVCLCAVMTCASAQEARPHIQIRGIYGGVPVELMEHDKLQDYGVNAIFMGSGSLNAERLALLKKQGARVFAEFNTMHVADYVKDHSDSAPVGVDGKVCPPPEGWQGVCPTHPGYRRFRMDAFRKVLSEFEIDGIWLDYHHSHASWERAVPVMPDTCFCERCLAMFRRETKTNLPNGTASEVAQRILDRHKDTWVQWRCDVFTDWVREFRAIVNETRPNALLGTFHCPWTDTDFDGALRNKLAIDLKAQAEYIDVFSIMPYHARFGHAADPSWIAQQTAWLGQHLGIKGEPGERHRIWPIVQLADWGESVPTDKVQSILDYGTRRPATGVMVFNWGWLKRQMDKVDAMGDYYRAIRPLPNPDEKDRMLFSFDEAEAAKSWTTVNDGVMGGRSVGRFKLSADKKLEFFGNLSLENNGGFASVRARGAKFGLENGDSVVARVRGDGREYNFNLYAQTDLGGYSYRQSFKTKKGDWIEVSLPVDRFVATWRGRVFPNEKLDPSKVAGLGILLGDKKPGPFKLEVEWIKASRSPPPIVKPDSN